MRKNTLADWIELSLTFGLMHSSAAHYIKTPFPYEEQDAQELCNSQRSKPLTPLTTQCHQSERGEGRKSLNMWKMDSGEVQCSGSSQRINGATTSTHFFIAKGEAFSHLNLHV